MRFICELREGEPISGIYLCKNKQNLKTKAGKSYYSMILQDKTGTVDAKIWELNNGIEHFESLDFIKIDGQITSFQGALQVNGPPCPPDSGAGIRYPGLPADKPFFD